MLETGALQINVHEQAGLPIVAARGDVDLATTPALREVLVSACSAQSGTHNLAVDLREVAFIDSAGLALLVEMRKQFRDNCEIVLIIAKGSQPERVLRLGRFDTFLQIGYTPEEVATAA